MTIIAVFPPYVYSMLYGDGEEKDEYHRLLGLWTDVDYLMGYFEVNCSRMVPEVWGDYVEPEIVASQAFEEAYELEGAFWNSAHGLGTGGGIKVCRTMQEDPDLNKELDKIKKVRSFLREQGIESQEDF